MLYGTKKQRGDWSFRLMLYGGLNILPSKLNVFYVMMLYLTSLFCIISDPTGLNKRIRFSEKEISIIG